MDSEIDKITKTVQEIEIEETAEISPDPEIEEIAEIAQEAEVQETAGIAQEAETEETAEIAQETEIQEIAETVQEAVIQVDYVLTYKDKVANCNVIAKPMASERLLLRCMKLGRQAKRTGESNIIVGLNEVQRALRTIESGLVLIAGDVRPVDVMSHLPGLCEDATIPYIYVPSRVDLGKDLNLPHSCVAVLIKYNPEYEYKYFKASEKIIYKIPV